jgi:tetratricopeptide (TPR) repeat protein
MIIENWAIAYRYCLYIGTAFVAIGTIGGLYCSSIIDPAKDFKIDQLVKGNEELQKGNRDLLNKIQYYQNDLETKQHEIERLKTEAIKSRKGVISSWDYNGIKRDGTAGKMVATAGAECAVFQQLMSLMQEKDYPEIIRLTSEQIGKTPDWLTPYELRGFAYANTGKIPEAIGDFQHVIENAAGDPAYFRSAECLKTLTNTIPGQSGQTTGNKPGQ